LRFQRFRSVDQVPPAILEVALEMTAVAEKLVNARVCFVRHAVAHVTADSLSVLGGTTFHGGCLGTHCAGARELVCFLLTIGSTLDDRVHELSDRKDLLEALFLDTAGWLAIERTFRSFRASLAARLRREGFRLTPRLGPGYLDWPLTEQVEFFSLFDGVRAPVTLTEHCVMVPKHSLSGLFGLIHDSGVSGSPTRSG
ncbi:MAG: hypothetical protein ACE5FK_03575, partial [Candidatus Methylomirabilia bacterium]